MPIIYSQRKNIAMGKELLPAVKPIHLYYLSVNIHPLYNRNLPYNLLYLPQRSYNLSLSAIFAEFSILFLTIFINKLE